MPLTTITASTVLALFAALSDGSAPTGDYLYNADIADGRVECLYVCASDDRGRSYRPKLRCSYAYDDANRLVCRQVDRWDARAKDYVPAYCLTYGYDGTTTTLEHQAWNARRRAYDAPQERYVYDALTSGDACAVRRYAWDAPSQTFLLTHTIAPALPDSAGRMAEGK